MADPLFNHGNYYDSAYPCTGMKLAREIATITYRSGPEWEKRFGRQRLRDTGCPQHGDLRAGTLSTTSRPPTLGPDFTVEAYLEHQGKKWCNLFDPNSMILISKVGPTQPDTRMLRSPSWQPSASLEAPAVIISAVY